MTEFLELDGRVRILDANAADGSRLVELAAFLLARGGYADEADGARRVLDSLYGASGEDDRARQALDAWARRRAGFVPVVRVAFGDPLSFAAEPVQGLLFDSTVLRRPPVTFEAAPFDVVIADVPRIELDAEERERLRGRYVSAVGRFTGEAPFVERVIGLASLGGLVVLRMRMAVLRRDFGRALVEQVLSRSQMLAVRLEDGMVTVALRRAAAPNNSSVALLRALGEVGAAEILERIEASGSRLDDLVSGGIGSTSTPGCDEVWTPAQTWRDLPTMPMVRGDDVGNLRLERVRRIVWPHDPEGNSVATPDPRVLRWLSAFRPHLEQRRYFGRTLEERRLRWFDYLDHHPRRWSSTPTIVLARGGSFVRAALVRSPIVVIGNAIALTPRDEERGALLLGALTSSVGTFWMKQRFHLHGSGAHTAFEATAQGLADFPIPAGGHASIIEIAKRCDRLARSIREPTDVIEGDPARLCDRLDALHLANARALRQLQFWQEELDWAAYHAYGLLDEFRPRAWTEQWGGERACECDDALDDEVLEQRVRAIENNRLIAALEGAEFKRPLEENDPLEREREALRCWLAWRIHSIFEDGLLPRDQPVSVAQVEQALTGDALATSALGRLDMAVEDLMLASSVPWEAARLYSASGLRKAEKVRAGQSVTFLPDDFGASGATRRRIWLMRGRYDVPRELFIHLCALSEAMDQPLFAWASASEADKQRLAEVVASEGEAPQLDLDRIMGLTGAIRAAPSLTTRQLAQRMWILGWSYRDVRAVLDVLESKGAIHQESDRWSLTEP